MQTGVKTRRRSWPVLMTGGLQIGEALFLIGLGAILLRPLGRPLAFEQLPRILNGLALAGLGAVMLANAAGFWAGWRHTWIGAMFFQGMLLLLALNLYLREKPLYAYPLLLAGVTSVLYLNHADVLAAFPAPETADER